MPRKSGVYGGRGSYVGHGHHKFHDRSLQHRPRSRAMPRRYAAVSPASSFFGARIVTEPPAFSTAATADFEAPQTENATLAFSSPLPSRRTPSLGAAQHAGLDQGGGVDGARNIELAGIDRLSGRGRGSPR